jgi:2-haloacid dehalogenase
VLDFDKYEVLSFDCYGTLIDWENGILSAIRPILSTYHIDLGDQQILELYAEIESEAEKSVYRKYRDILRNGVQRFGDRLGFIPTSSEVESLPLSLKDWKPFPDTVEALQAFKRKFKLTILSNVDDDLFAESARHLKVPFDWIITAEQAKSYKPSLNNFRLAIQKMGILPEKLLHVAQSLYHDIVPAKSLGLSTVWVNRRKDKQGFGATLPANSEPDLEVPDLKTLVSTMGLG